MAVAEKGVGSDAQHFETTDLQQSNGHHATTTTNKTEKPNNNHNLKTENNNGEKDCNSLEFEKQFGGHENGACLEEEKKLGGGVDEKHPGLLPKGVSNIDIGGNLSDGEGLKREIAHLEEMLTKLNPMAKEFVPPSLVGYGSVGGIGSNGFGYGNNFLIHPNPLVNVNGFNGRRRRNNYGQEKRRMNSRTSMAQREDVIRRTVYVSDIDQQVTEEQLAALFINCGQVVDCRICGDPNSILRFAFVEFTDEDGARSALSMSSTLLGYYPVRVLPSKTAIAPVNPTLLPKSEDEREMCARTVYCTNIDRKVTQAEIKLFFESFCGEIRRLRLLGDYNHSTRIAFVEFVIAESAIAALNCSGAILGSLPIRVSPSKTPVRPRPPRSPLH